MYFSNDVSNICSYVHTYQLGRLGMYMDTQSPLNGGLRSISVECMSNVVN